MSTTKLLVSNFLLLFLFIQKGQTWFTCDEVEYCTRIRYKEPSDAFYIDGDSFEEGRAVFSLVNSETNKRFEFSFSATAEDTVRITIDDPQNPRHRVIDALDGEPETLTLNEVEIITNGYVIKAGHVTVTIESNPFRLSVSTDDQGVVAELNSKRRLVFEEQEPEVAVALDITFPGAQRAYGLPSHPDRLPLRNTRSAGRDPYRFYNIDHAAYETNSTQAVYGAIPVLYAFSKEQSVGVFWQNSAQTFVDIENEDGEVSSYFFSESGVIDLFVLTGPTLRDAVKQYARLTGNF